MPIDLSQHPWLLRLAPGISDVPPSLAVLLTSGIPAAIPSSAIEILTRGGFVPDPSAASNEPLAAWASRADWIYQTTINLEPAPASSTYLSFDSLDTVATVTVNGIVAGSSESEFIPWSRDIAPFLRAGPNTVAVTFTSPLRAAHERAALIGPRPVNGDWEPFNMLRKCASSFEWDWGPRIPSAGILGSAFLSSTPPSTPTDPAPGSPRRSQWSLRTEAGAFTILARGAPFFALGANWIPEGLFPSDRTPAKVRPLLEAAKAAGMNMIRVWGGGRYEPDWFYELCDELGLAVWQDFMFACACYPEEEPLRSLIDTEARLQVARLTRHPCIALFCGGNENHWAYQSWGFKEKLAPSQTWGRTYWQSLLPSVVSELAPSIPYTPDSPWSGDESIHPNDPDRGDRHSWDVNFWDHWSGGYQKVIPRFCSEFGQQSPSNIATLAEARVLPSDPARSPSETAEPSWSAQLMGPALARRQRGPGGNQRWYDEPLDALFRRPRTFDQFHFAAQLLQARALRTATHWHRVNSPRCAGSLLWQLNDAWPGLSWSIIDSAGRLKPAYHAVKSAMQPRTASFHLVDGQLTLYGVNDTDEHWEETPTLTLVSFTGDIVRRWPCSISIPPRTSARIGRLGAPDEITREPSRHLVALRSPTTTAEWFFLPDRLLEYPAPEIRRLRITPIQGGVHVYLRAGTLIRDLHFPADVLDPAAVADDSLLTLLPTERCGFSIHAPPDFLSRIPRSEEDGVDPWLFLRCANHL